MVDADLTQAERILARARSVSGAAAVAYFFRESSAVAYSAYLSALEAEVEAEEILDDLRRARTGAP